MIPLAHLLRPSPESLKQARAALAAGEEFTLDFPRVHEWFAAQKNLAVEERIKELRQATNLFESGHADLLEARLKVLRAVYARDDQAVTAASLHLAQCAVPSVAELEQLVPQIKKSQRGFKHPMRYTAATLAARAQKRLDRLGFDNITIRFSTRKRLRVTFRPDGTGSLRIPKNLNLTRQRARRVLAHEIDIHVGRAFNARQSGNPLLLLPTLGSKMTEEGLAIWHQDTVVKKSTTPSGFWDAYTIALMNEGGAQTAYTHLLKYKTPKKAARLVLRACRGIHKPGGPGRGFLFDHLYFVGAQKITALTTEERATLMTGRFGLELLSTLE
jgi:hypothetical protein